MTVEVVLSADIGGTNTRLSLYEVNTSGNFVQIELNKVDKLPAKMIFQKKYANDGHDSLLEVIRLFLNESGTNLHPTTACLAVAGPVSNNCAKLTNRSRWDIIGKALGDALNLKRIRVINDFVAAGYGLLTLNEEKECFVLQHAEKRHDAPIACIGAGTGLGECFITPNGLGGYECYPSEGGHAEFAPRNDVEVRMLQYLSHKFETRHRISVERIVSGYGLANVYEFLATRERPDDVTPAVHNQIMAAPESARGAIVATNADDCAICAHTMRILTAAYGAEAGVAGLKWLPSGGLYLAGGMTPKLIEYIKGNKPGTEGLFMGALLDKGRVSGMLKNVPIYAVMVEDLGERGAQYTALRLLQELHSTGKADFSAALTETATDLKQKAADFAHRNTTSSLPSHTANPLPSHAALLGVLGLGFAAGVLAVMLRRPAAP